MLDRELVERARAGDHDAFSALVMPELARLHGLAGLILSDPTRVEDALQEALIRAWRGLPRLRDTERLRPWLRRLVINACRDEGRRLGRRREVALAPGHDDSQADDSEAVVARDQLARAFAALTHEERAVVVLRHYLGLSSAEASTALNMREATYRSKLHRALRRLRRSLAGDRVQQLREGRSS